MHKVISKSDFFIALPDDLILYIVMHLDRCSVGRILQVCKIITTMIASSEFLWKQLTLNATPIEDRYEVEAQVVSANTLWKDAFRDLSTKF